MTDLQIISLDGIRNKTVLFHDSDSGHVALVNLKTVQWHTLENMMRVVGANADYNLPEIEKNTISSCLAKNNGNIVRTSHDLGISRRSLYRKIEAYKLERLKKNANT